ncbi:MAG: LysR substrate-binding domain-containing protein [Pseudomonadota bacterium]
MERDPTLNQLKSFSVLADVGNYRKAAERIGITQPALSYQISGLEERLAVSLFERGRSGVVLTPAGREVLSLSTRILDALGALKSLSNRLENGAVSELRLGASPTLGPYFLPNAIQALRARFPTLRVFIHEAAPRQLLEGLLAGRHDVIITQLPLQSAEITIDRLFREPLKLAVARTHALARKAEIVEADLAGETVLSLTRDFTLHDQLSELCRSVGALLRQDYEGTSLDALRQMTAMDMGLTFLPAAYVRSEIRTGVNDLEIVPFRGDRLTRSIGLAWRKTSNENLILENLGALFREVAERDFQGVLIVE